MAISSRLSKLLICPVTRKELTFDRRNQELISYSAGLAYPIMEGIPIMLIDKGRKINEKILKQEDHLNSIAKKE